MNQVKEATRSYRMQEWADIIRDRKASGETIKAYCKERGIKETSYYYWLKKIREEACNAMDKTKHQAIVPLTVLPENKKGASEGTAVILNRGEMTIAIQNGAKQETIAGTLAALHDYAW